MSLSNIIAQYEAEVDLLPATHAQKGGGKSRNSSGLVYENLIQRVCDAIGVDARRNDYQITEEIEGNALNNLQVDKHIYRDNVFVKAVESKAYLDSSMLRRAIFDFLELHHSPDVPDNVEYAIFMGQDACSGNSLDYYTKWFKKHTGKEVKVFVLNPQEKRNSSRPIYESAWRDNFVLNQDTFYEFVEWLQK